MVSDSLLHFLLVFRLMTEARSFIKWIQMCLYKLLWYSEACGLRLAGKVETALFKNSVLQILRKGRSALDISNMSETLKWIWSISVLSCILALVYLVYVKICVVSVKEEISRLLHAKGGNLRQMDQVVCKTVERADGCPGHPVLR